MSRPGFRYLAGAPLLIAHRGGSGLAPENTIYAFRRALQWWRADLLEIDVQPTRDGDAVVIHDPTVDRTTDGSGAVAGMTVRELGELDAGYRYSPDGSSYPLRGAGVRISTLREVLEAFPGARVNVEIKDARAQEPVWETVRALGAEQRVLIAAGDRKNRARFASYAGPTSAASQEMYAFFALHKLGLGRFYRPAVDAWQMPDRHGDRQVLGPRWVKEAHAKNVAVHVWTIDEVADMRRLLAWGVDGIISDRPDRLARVLHEVAGRPLPPGPPEDEMEPWLARLLRA